MANGIITHIRDASQLTALLNDPAVANALFQHGKQFFPDEAWPHFVHYQKHRVIYVPPDEFLTWRPSRPSDCIWIVPGTLERKL